MNLDIKISAHTLCKMRIFYEPKKGALGNTQHFVDKKRGGGGLCSMSQKIEQINVLTKYTKCVG